jgi:uncharacterized membrane protein YccC
MGARAQHASRVAVSVTACSSLVLAASLSPFFEFGWWAVFTSIMLSEDSFGGSLRKAVNRICGTAIGAAFGVFVLGVIPATDPPDPAATAVRVALIALWVAIVGYGRADPASGYAAFCAAFTGPLIIIGYDPALTPDPGLYASSRLLCTFAGLAVVLFVYSLPPWRWAGDSVRCDLARTFQALRHAVSCIRGVHVGGRDVEF